MTIVKISKLKDHVGSIVTMRGWLEILRDQKRMQFVVLRDASGVAQAVHEKGTSEEIASVISTLTVGSFLSITGEVVAAPHVKLGGIEVMIKDLEVATIAETPLPIACDSSLDKQIDWRQISLRSARSGLIFRVQTTLEHAMRTFFTQNGFIELHSPKLMGVASESGAEVFKVDYFETKAFLAQSPQFYKQLGIVAGFEKVFEIGPAFRAEPSFTPRHETEFTSVDAEIAWVDSHEDIMALEETMLSFAIAAVKDAHGDEIEAEFGKRIVVPTTPFPRLTVAQAREAALAQGHVVTRIGDLDPEGERLTSAHVKATTGHEFCFITDYPAANRAFYHMRRDDDPTVTKGFDLLWNGIEITTGAQREHRHGRLIAQALERGYGLEALEDYLNFFRYGSPPHGGFGLGLARLLTVLLGLANIREVTLVSRSPTRLRP